MSSTLRSGCEATVGGLERRGGLDWTGEVRFTSFGARIGIRVDDPAFFERIPRHLPPGSEVTDALAVDKCYTLTTTPCRPELGGNVVYRVLVEGRRLARTRDVDEAFAMLESCLEIGVSRNARGVVFVHAGVVGWRGRAILIPGRSRSGKTSLVAELLRAGATYYSDEFAVVDSEGRVHPYPRPLSVRQAGLSRPRRCRVEELGAHAGADPLPVGHIVLTRYRDGKHWRPRPVSTGLAVLGLFDNTVLARSQPQFSLSVLHRVACCATAVKSPRGEAREVVHFLLDEEP